MPRDLCCAHLGSWRWEGQVLLETGDGTEQVLLERQEMREQNGYCWQGRRWKEQVLLEKQEMGELILLDTGDVEAPIAGKAGDEGTEQILLDTGNVEAPIAGRAAHLVQPAEL